LEKRGKGLNSRAKLRRKMKMIIVSKINKKKKKNFARKKNKRKRF
jgi:hypothetical protein